MQQYGEQRYGVVSSGGLGTTRYQQPGAFYLPENIDFGRSAAGIAAEVFFKGGRGAVDINLGLEAVRPPSPGEVKAVIDPSLVNIAGISDIGQRINVSLGDIISGRQPQALIDIESGIQRGASSLPVGLLGYLGAEPQTFSEKYQIYQKEQQQQSFVNNLPLPFISTPSQGAVSTQGNPIAQQQQPFDLLNFLGLGGGAVGQQAFQSAVSGQHPAAVQQGGMGFGMPQYASDEIMRMSEGFGSAFWGGVGSIFGGGRGVSAGGGADIGSPMVQAPGIVTEAKLPGTATVYTPFGEYAQTAVENAKLAIDPLTGELGIYQQTRAGNWMLVGGGGRAAGIRVHLGVSERSPADLSEHELS